MTSDSDNIISYPTGWCFTCDTNDCRHVVELNSANKREFIRLLAELKLEKKLPGLTGEPWRKND